MPPFIAIDQEGGRVHRLPQPFTHFPAAARIGARNDPELAYRLGRATAAELALAGINLNFAPVLDVQSKRHKSDHRRPRLRRRSRERDRNGVGLDQGAARRRRYSLRQTLSRPWRHR